MSDKIEFLEGKPRRLDEVDQIILKAIEQILCEKPNISDEEMAKEVEKYGIYVLEK